MLSRKKQEKRRRTEKKNKPLPQYDLKATLPAEEVYNVRNEIRLFRQRADRRDPLI